MGSNGCWKFRAGKALASTSSLRKAAEPGGSRPGVTRSGQQKSGSVGCGASSVRLLGLSPEKGVGAGLTCLELNSCCWERNGTFP